MSYTLADHIRDHAILGTIDSGSSFGGFGNPTASVGLTIINGSATTAMRSDAAPPLSQAIAPTWTGSHIWEPSADATPVTIKAKVGQTTPPLVIHAYDASPGTSVPWAQFTSAASAFPRLDMGYLGSGDPRMQIWGYLSTASQADTNASALSLVVGDSLQGASTNAFALRITNSPDAKTYLVIGPQGEVAIGSGVIQAGAALSFIGNTSVSPFNITRGMYGLTQHANNSIAAPQCQFAIHGVSINSVSAASGGSVAGNYAGIRGDVYCTNSTDPTVGTTELSAVIGAFSNSPLSAATIDFPAGGTRLRGAWTRVSAFRAGFIATGSGASTRPLINTAIYAPIQAYAAATGECWAIETAAPTASGTPSPIGTAGGVKCAHPNVHVNYGARKMHQHWVPHPVPAFSAGGYGNNVRGDLDFDDGTNNQSGLWEYTTAWAKLLSGLYASPSTNGGTALGGNGLGWSSLWLKDTAAAFEIQIQATNTGIGADRVLTIDMGNAARTLNLIPSAAYTPTNVTTDRSWDCNATSIDELSDVLATVVQDLQAKGILG